MPKFFTFAFLVCAAVALNVRAAHAGSIGPTCGSCQGSVYTLENLGLVTDIYTGDNTLDTWRIMLTIDTSGYEHLGTAVRIDEVAVKVSSGVSAARLVDAPGGTAVWTLAAGGLNANGCSGSGSGFECSDFVGLTGGAVIPGPLLQWVFDIDVSGPLFTGTDGASIKARYVDQYGEKVGALVSENITLGGPSGITPVPEPGTMALLAGGLALVAARQRRARR